MYQIVQMSEKIINKKILMICPYPTVDCAEKFTNVGFSPNNCLELDVIGANLWSTAPPLISF